MSAAISKTGYWDGQNAHIHHVHSESLANFITGFLYPDKDKRVWDLGCGLGEYLRTLEQQGFYYLIGIEGDVPVKKVSNHIYKGDLTKRMDVVETERGNVICLEVLEHIPAEYTDIVLDNIEQCCNGYLILSWAVRGQPGYGHVNCLDNHEVINIFEKRGFKYLPEQSADARGIVGDNTPWFRNTIMIFEKYD